MPDQVIQHTGRGYLIWCRNTSGYHFMSSGRASWLRNFLANGAGRVVHFNVGTDSGSHTVWLYPDDHQAYLDALDSWGL